MFHNIVNLLVSFLMGERHNLMSTVRSKLFHAVLLAGLLAHGIVPVRAAGKQGTSTDVHPNSLNVPVLSPLMSPYAWNALGSGLNDIVYAIETNGTDVYVGGQFTAAGGNLNANYIASWDGSSWSALGTGLNGDVYTIAVFGGSIYAGGMFTDAGGDSNADYIARWDGSNWTSVGNGLGGAGISVYSIGVDGSNFYIAGSFLDAGSVANADYIAKLDGGSWESLGSTPLNGPVNSIIVAGATVYAGGDFLDAGGASTADRIAQWDGTSWSALGSGLNSSVTAVALGGGNLYAGGMFTDAGGNNFADRIARWDGTSWLPLGNGLSSYVHALVVDGSNLYAAGNFLAAGSNSNANYIAKWDGSSWSALNSTPLNSTVAALALDGMNLYVGGDFTDAGGSSSADKVVRFEMTNAPMVTAFTALSPSPSLNIPITSFTALDNQSVSAYMVTDSATPPSAEDAGWSTTFPTAYTVGSDGTYTLYPWAKDAVGNVSDVYGSPLNVTVDTTSPSVSTTTWNALGNGLSNIVYDLAVSGNDLYATGSFLDAGSYLNGDRIAKWNGTAWSPLGSGLNAQSLELTVDGSTVYAGGHFIAAGGTTGANYIAQWNGSNWSTVGNGNIGGNVNAIAASGSNLYMGGGFGSAGGSIGAAYLAQLNGNAWQPMGATPFDSSVFALLIDGSNVYAGGSFQNAGGNASADSIAMWNGSSWSALGSGANNTVYCIVKANGQFYVGGSFGGAGGVANADRIAIWNGTSWSALGSGLNGAVYAMAVSGSNVYVGGLFTDAGGDPNADYIAKWNGTSWSAVGNSPLNGHVDALAINGPYLYAGGSFTDAGGNTEADRIAMWVIDATTPSVTSFDAPSATNSLEIPIAEFTASDDIAVTGYRITESDTPPAAGAAGWTASAPSTYTVGSDGVYVLYPWVKDGLGNVSAAYGSPVSVTVDRVAPDVLSFAASSPSNSLSVPITTFTASDDSGVAAYLITQSNTAPNSNHAGWTASAPTTYTVAGNGSYTLYPWVKDSAGNISSVHATPSNVTVDVTKPIVTAFSIPASSASLNIPITTFTASDNLTVSGYKITTSNTPPSAGAAGWTGSAPTTYAVGGSGSYTLYPWVKDSAGNVSAVFGSPATVAVDVVKPTVSSFTASSPSTSLNISITAFTASDNVAVTGYTITESSAPPSAGAAGWTASAPTSYSVGGDGTYTLYPWAKDAAGNVSAVYGSPASVTVDTGGDVTAPIVTSFSVPSPSTSLSIAITDFAASDDVSVTAYLITESATPPSSGDASWTASAPTTYSVGSDGAYTLYPWAKDAAGNVSAVYGSPASVDVDASSTVTNTNDSGAGSLRAILATAAPGDTVSFDPSLSGGTIYLASTLTLSKNVTIDGSMLASKITISGDSDNNGTRDQRVFYVDSAVTAVLKNLIVTKGYAEEGGGLINYGTLTIVNSTFSDNSALAYGGALSNNYQLTITDSTFSGNSAYDGGALLNSNTLTISGSTFSSNSADGSGGTGGAIYNAGPATITNSTIAVNSAAVGGGILTTQPLSITNGTISGNSAIIAGGLDIEGYTTDLSNTIIANSTGGDCVNNSTIGTNANNLVQDGSCSPSLSGDPNLGPLQDNGGPSQTMAIDANSPAFNAVSSGGCPVADQRGTPRPQGSYCDIGAYEYLDLTPPAVSSITRVNLDPTNAASLSFTVIFSEPVTGVDTTDFTVTATGPVGAETTSVSGSGAAYTVAVKTGSGDGTLRLDVVDNDSILDALNNPLGGAGNDNGAFTSGEEYSVIKSAVKPGIPALLAPATGALTTSLLPSFDWKDSLPAAHRYQIQISTNSTFTALAVDDTNVSNSDFMPPSALVPGKLYYWRVRALNVVRVASNWSAVRTSKTPLAQPTLGSPIAGVSLVKDRPSFGWTSVDGATQYTLQVSALGNFSTLLLNANVNTNQYDMTKDLLQNKILYWRVRAGTPAVSGPWSLRESFKTGNPATVPALSAPANNALVKNYKPLLNWKDSAVPAGTTFKYYILEVDNNNNFSSPEVTATPTASQFTPGSDLDSNTKYYWRVLAVNTVNGVDHISGWSPTWSFRTVIPAPQALAVIPTGEPLKPAFEWDDATGPISGYTIQISTSATFSTFIVNSTTMNSTYTMIKNLPSGKVIYWRVRVNGANGPSAWTTTQFPSP